MRRQIYFLMILSAILMVSCQPAVTFDQPQPADIYPISGFPKGIQGQYQSIEDNSFLNITENALIRVYDFDLKTHVSQIDSTKQLIGDTLYDFNSNEGILVQFEGDSIVQHVFETDTLFRIDELNVLKKYKGYYFVNIFTLPETWQVKELELHRGMLTLASINSKEDIDQLRELTDSAQDTVPYVFSPTKKEFRDFIRNKGFRDKESFAKIR